MTRIKKPYSIYKKIPPEVIKNGTMVTSVGEVDLLVNDALANKAHSMRIMRGSVYNYPHDDSSDTTPDMIFDVEDGKSKTIFQFNTHGMITGAAGRLKACVYLLTDGVVGDLDLTLQYGKHSITETGIDTATFAWKTVTLSINANTDPKLFSNSLLHLFVTANGADFEVTVRSYCVFEYISDTNNVSFIDISGANSKVGLPDMPYSSALAHILSDNNHANRNQRCARQNLMNQCFHLYKYDAAGIDTAYDADSRGIGNWRIQKSQGVDEIVTRTVISGFGTAAKTVWAKLSLYTTAGALVDSNEWSYLLGGLAFEDYEDYTFSALSTDTTEYELRLDTKAANPGEIFLVITKHMFAREGLDGSDDNDLVLPARKDVQTDDDLIVRPLLNTKNTQVQTWNRNRQILVNDGYIFTTSSAHDLLTEARQVCGDHTYKLCGGVFYPSYGSEYLICYAKLSKPSLTNRLAIHYDGGAGTPFTIGERVDEDNGAHGTVVDDDGTIVYLKEVNGTFHDNINMTGATSGDTADVNGTSERPNITTKVKFIIATSTISSYGDTDIAGYHEIDVSNFANDMVFDVSFAIRIPSTFWNVDNYGVTWPYYFYLLTTPSSSASENDIDFVYLHEIHVYEEVQFPLIDSEQ